jgi:hypothetical protein
MDHDTEAGGPSVLRDEVDLGGKAVGLARSVVVPMLYMIRTGAQPAGEWHPVPQEPDVGRHLTLPLFKDPRPQARAIGRLQYSSLRGVSIARQAYDRA